MVGMVGNFEYYLTSRINNWFDYYFGEYIVKKRYGWLESGFGSGQVKNGC